MDIPPMASRTAPHGVVGEIVLEAMKRAHLTPRLIFMPKNRAIVTVQLTTAHDTLILPLARMPEREALFTWIAPLYRAERGFFTAGKPIRSFAEGRAALRSVAVARGTANGAILRAQGFRDDQIYDISVNQDAPRMLLEGRMGAWFGPLEEMALYLEQEAEGARIVAGPALITTENYLACARQCDPVLVGKLREALARMEKEGVIKAIRARHGHKGAMSAVTDH
jgi:polar amino acid transport system substrate-binding protein